MVFALPTCAQHDTIEFEAFDNRESHRSALTGVTNISARSGGHWGARITLSPKRREQAEAWFGSLIRGITEPFYLSPPDSAQTIYQASSGISPGTPRIKGASQTGTSLITDGWTEDFIIKTGDYLEFTASGYSWLFKHIGAAVTASGATGDATLTVWPPVFRSPADNALITTSNPRAEMLLKQPRQSMSTSRFNTSRQSFEAFQWVR